MQIQRGSCLLQQGRILQCGSGDVRGDFKDLRDLRDLRVVTLVGHFGRLWFARLCLVSSLHEFLAYSRLFRVPSPPAASASSTLRNSKPRSGTPGARTAVHLSCIDHIALVTCPEAVPLMPARGVPCVAQFSKVRRRISVSLFQRHVFGVPNARRPSQDIAGRPGASSLAIRARR